MPALEAVVAVCSDWGIGANGTQSVALRADRRRFRLLTEGSAVIVGRRTLEDFPGSGGFMKFSLFFFPCYCYNYKII